MIGVRSQDLLRKGSGAPLDAALFKRIKICNLPSTV
jgi:hypothetical protein